MSTTPASVDDLDDLLGLDESPAAPSTDEKEQPYGDPPSEDPPTLPDPEHPGKAPIEDAAPTAAEEKPKRTRRTKAQIEADNAAKAIAGMSDDEADRLRLELLTKRAAALRGEQPKPESELTPIQRQIRAAEDGLARDAAAALERDPVAVEQAPADASDAKGITIHMLTDGFVINGRVTYRGEEFYFAFGGQAFEQTKNVLGQSFLELADDPGAQARRWGEPKFAAGRWLGGRSVTAADAPREVPAAEREAWAAQANRGFNRPLSAPVSRASGF